MTAQWSKADSGKRPALYANVNGHRLFVQQTVRSYCARGLVGTEYQAMVGGKRIAEYPSLALAQAAAVEAAQTKMAPQGRTCGTVVASTAPV